MHNIFFTAEAKNNIHDIKSYIDESNPWYSDHVISVIINVINNLSYFPNLWKDVDWFEWVKELIEPNFKHRIIYRINNNPIEILTIFKYQDKYYENI